MSLSFKIRYSQFLNCRAALLASTMDIKSHPNALQSHGQLSRNSRKAAIEQSDRSLRLHKRQKHEKRCQNQKWWTTSRIVVLQQMRPTWSFWKLQLTTLVNHFKNYVFTRLTLCQEFELSHKVLSLYSKVSRKLCPASCTTMMMQDDPMTPKWIATPTARAFPSTINRHCDTETDKCQAKCLHWYLWQILLGQWKAQQLISTPRATVGTMYNVMPLSRVAVVCRMRDFPAPVLQLTCTTRGPSVLFGVIKHQIARSWLVNMVCPGSRKLLGTSGMMKPNCSDPIVALLSLDAMVLQWTRQVDVVIEAVGIQYFVKR